MKFLVLGVSGMAGHVIALYLKEKGHEVLGYGRKKINYVKTIIGDAQNTDSLQQVIKTGKFDAVINAIGILNQYAENDKEVAVFLNAYLPHYLAKITSDMDTQIIHMSTDCVFAGNTGPYKEGSLRDGVTFYDRSKALGELEDDKNITFRNSIVGPDMNENGIGLLNWFMKQDEVYGYSHAMWTGLTTLQLAKVMEVAAISKVHGLYNMVYDNNISKFELLNLFNHYIRNDKVVVKSSNQMVIDKTLIRTNFNFDFIIPDYETMISEMAGWMRKNANLYPHYHFK